MPQIVNAQTADAGVLADGDPILLYRDAMLGSAIGREQPFRMRALAQLSQRLPGLPARRIKVIRLLLGGAALLGPGACGQIYAGKVGCHSFADAAAGPQAQTKNVSCLLVLVPIECIGQPLQFSRTSITLALMFDVAFDPFGWVVTPHAPTDGERKHFRRHRHDAIGLRGMASL